MNLRVENLDPHSRVVVETYRLDIPRGEPQSLRARIELAPGEASLVQLFPGSVIAISEEAPRE